MAVTLGIKITQNSQSIVDNKSNVTVSVSCTWNGWSYNIQEIVIGMPTATGWLEIEGEKFDFRSTFNDNLTETGTKTIFTKTLDIYHDTSGKKTLTCSAYYRTGVSSGDITAENSLKLTDIPRYAQLESAPNFNDESNPTITYSNLAGENIDSLQACISLDGNKDDVAYRDISKTGSSYTFNLTEAERNILRAATTESNSRTVIFFVRSSIGGNIKHSTLNRTLSIINANPILTPSVIDTNSKTVNVTGDNSVLVALHSTAQVTLNEVAQKFSTIKSKKIEHGNQVLTANGVLSITNNPIKFTVEDSRGNETVQNATNTVIPYINPTCSIGNNIPEADGSFDLEVTGIFYNASIGKTSNRLTVQYRVKAGHGNYGDWTAIGSVTVEGNSYIATASLSGLDYQTVYAFQARVIDVIHTEGLMSAEKSVIAEPVFHWGQNDFQFNVPVVMKPGCDILKNGETAYAPAGYGLGALAGMPVTTDCNTATKNGWYYVKGATNAASPYDHAMLVVGYGQTALTQIAFMGNTYSSNTYIIIRKRYGANWNEWEYLNPACSVGVEYRTTERWDGIPVYTQLLDYGTTTEEMSVYRSVPGITRLLRAVPNHNNTRCGEWNNGTVGVHTYNNLFFAFGMTENQEVVCYFKCGQWGVGFNLKAQIWYTK